jgi:3-hydroxybutyryl-CoA dehydrogenase
MTNKSIGVIGAGTMGNGIAHVFARSGFSVILCERQKNFLDRGLATIDRNLGREVAAGKLADDQSAAARARIQGSLDYEELGGCSLVIEAVNEDLAIKTAIFHDLDNIVSPEAILASNTSSISITKLAGKTKHPQRVIGMHFFNPVPLMKLVEVVRGLATSAVVNETVHDLARQLGKTPIEVHDAPGFVSNRVLMQLINEAVFTVMEGVATAQAVDEVFKLGMAHPMGPLALADFIGLDVCLNILGVLQEGLGDAKFRPCPLLVQMVDAGWLGKKSGRGFYQYSPAPRPAAGV